MKIAGVMAPRFSASFWDCRADYGFLEEEINPLGVSLRGGGIHPDRVIGETTSIHISEMIQFNRKWERFFILSAVASGIMGVSWEITAWEKIPLTSNFQYPVSAFLFSDQMKRSSYRILRSLSNYFCIMRNKCILITINRIGTIRQYKWKL